MRLTIAGDSLELDFAGTAEQVEGNLNCPLSVTKSAAFFAVRVLTDPDGPPCAGAHRPVEVSRPRGLAAQRARRRPRSPPATSRPRAGSPTSCSRRSRAPPRPRAGPGDDEQPHPRGRRAATYYETLGGGQGACPDADGPSAIHVAMSNTLNTPVEALETEYPGAGARARAAPRLRRRRRQRGGDGIVRELEALEPMRFTLITERRRRRAARAATAAPTAPRAQPAQRRGTAGEMRGRARPRATGCGSKPRAAAGSASRERLANRSMQHRSQTWHFEARFPRLAALDRAWTPHRGDVSARTKFTESSPQPTRQCLLPSKNGP